MLESLAVPPLTCCQQQNTSEVLTCWRPLITATQYQSGLSVFNSTEFQNGANQNVGQVDKRYIKKTKQHKTNKKKTLCSHTQRVTWLSYIYKSIQCLAAKVKEWFLKKESFERKLWLSWETNGENLQAQLKCFLKSIISCVFIMPQITWSCYFGYREIL